MEKQVFENKLFEMFPDAKTSGIISNKNIVEVMAAVGTKRFPHWMMTRVSRGVYAINSVDSPAAQVIPFKQKETSMVPAIDSRSEERRCRERV